MTTTIPTSTQASHLVLAEVATASRNWIAAFNRGDVDTCVATYLPNAEMVAAPMGTYIGHQQIDDFWRPFVAQGAGELVYSQVKLSEESDGSVLLAATWSMNVAAGEIHKERWIKDDQGAWRLAFDHFEVLEQKKA
ncbi:YybH family protein [Acanthopleuribacter pedis]|uniref:Nuclear transport factor 2 family protein n=1 Tax=Acanthopleuribacter pedis TaxID=442870 RepID=A0A8J7QI38_9BACT|nr:nuclear transport factor 2 family protein [Acanthopleuribacter pedis]MBO1320720.1 nuclear transport factor 2 family protein [Acanthopleuribacter pedis]